MTAGLQEVDVYSDKEYFCRPQQFPAAPHQKPRRLVALTPQPQKPRISLPQQLRAAPATYIYTRIPALAAVTFQWSPQLSPRLVRSGHHPPRSTTRRTPTSKQFGSERQTSLRPRVQRRPSGCLVIPGTATNRGAIRPLLVAKSQRHVQRRCEQPLLIIRVEGSRPLHGWLHCARFTRSFRP